MRPAAIGMAMLMVGAVGMHIKIGDALKKTTPALSVLMSDDLLKIPWLIHHSRRHRVVRYRRHSTGDAELLNRT